MFTGQILIQIFFTGQEIFNICVKIFLPFFLILPFLAFLAISNQLSYSQNSVLKNRSIAFVLGASAAITTLTFFYQKSADILQIAVLFLAVFSALMTLLPRQKILKQVQDDVGGRSTLTRHPELVSGSNIAMTLAHFGFSIIVIGIVLTSSFGLTKEINLKQGESLKIANYELKFAEVKYAVGKNFLARQGDFLIFENGKEIGKLRPQLRHYPVSEQSTNEASIKHGIFGDLYLVIGNKDEEENYAVRAYYKPFIYLIWLGCFLIFSAAIFKIFRHKNEK